MDLSVLASLLSRRDAARIGDIQQEIGDRVSDHDNLVTGVVGVCRRFGEHSPRADRRCQGVVSELGAAGTPAGQTQIRYAVTLVELRTYATRSTVRAVGIVIGVFMSFPAETR